MNKSRLFLFVRIASITQLKLLILMMCETQNIQLKPNYAAASAALPSKRWLLASYMKGRINMDTSIDGGYWVDGLYHDEIKPKAWKELPSLPKE